jgi:hypothetical protein
MEGGCLGEEGVCISRARNPGRGELSTLFLGSHKATVKRQSSVEKEGESLEKHDEVLR